jgi:transposase
VLLGVGSRWHGNRFCQEHRIEALKAAAAPRRERIQQMWLEGMAMRDIAAELEIPMGTLSVTMTRMRDQGWDLPLRYDVRRPEHAAARARRAGVGS